ncbi:type II membrane protein [Coemansia sp. RSA 552]|nr:type II membrane protein [Coemansia sp. RSA 552]
MRRALALRSLAGLVTLSFARAAFDCAHAQVAGFTYDLSPLARDLRLEVNATTPPTITATRYALNPCAPLEKAPKDVPEIDRCPEHAWICRSVVNHKDGADARLIEVGAVAGTAASDAPTLEARASSGSKEPPNFHWKMAGAEVDSVKWAADIKFVCDRSKNNRDLPELVSFTKGLLSLEWVVPAACALDGDGGGSRPPADDQPRDDDQQSSGFFSTLLTLAIVSATLYLVVGVLYKVLVVRASGIDIIPNLSFWREFPYLCADFARHLWDRAGGRSRNGYSVV